MSSAGKSTGFTLLELIAALVISAAVAAIGISFLRQPSTTSRQRSCDLTREVLQNAADRYREKQGRMPSRNLRELADTRYAGAALPHCPVTDRAYRINRDGVVSCPVHEATR